MFFVFRCYLLPLGAMTLYVLNVPKRHCKITTFPQTHKGMGFFSLFLSMLPQACHAFRFFSFSNRKDPNFTQTFRMFRRGSVRDFLVWHQQPCHADVCLRAGGHLWLGHKNTISTLYPTTSDNKRLLSTTNV